MNFIEYCSKGPKIALSGQKNVHIFCPCVQKDIDPLRPLPCCHSTSPLDHSQQGIGYRWPCAILGWLVICVFSLWMTIMWLSFWEWKKNFKIYSGNEKKNIFISMKMIFLMIDMLLCVIKAVFTFYIKIGIKTPVKILNIHSHSTSR